MKNLFEVIQFISDDDPAPEPTIVDTRKEFTRTRPIVTTITQTYEDRKT